MAHQPSPTKTAGNSQSPTSSPRAPEGAIEEYQSLRDEILKHQESRLVVLGFVFTAVGATSGLAAESMSKALSEGEGKGALWFLPALLLLYVSVVVIACGLWLTIAATQAIRRIGAYIAKYIEGVVPGLQYERRLESRRTSLGRGVTSTSMALSRSYAITYSMLLLVVVGLATALFMKMTRWEGIIGAVALGIPTTVACWFVYDLEMRRSRGWLPFW